MSILFHRKTKKTMQYVWMVLSVIIVLSMVVTYTGLSSVAPSIAGQDNAQTQTPTPSSVPSSTPSTVTSTSTPSQPVEKLPFTITP